MGWVVFIAIFNSSVWRRIAVGVSVALCLAAHATAADAGHVVRTWQTPDGLPQNSVNAVVQTRDGFLWVGTNAGLARFDGVRFRNFGLQDGLRSVVVLALAEDRAGALWIGTSGGGVSRWENGRFQTFDMQSGLPTGSDVIALAADRDGSVWVGTVEGLVQWRDGVFRTIGDAEGLPRNQVRALLSDAEGALWVSVIGGGVFRGVDGKFARMPKETPAPADVYCFAQGRDGTVWAGTNGGALWRWRDGAWSRLDPARTLPEVNVESVVEDSDGVLWVGLRNSGLYRSSGESFVRVESEGRFDERTVRALATDREGSVWAGTSSAGLHRLSPRVLDFRGTGAGLPVTTVTSVVEDASGRWWVGTQNKGLHLFDGSRFTPLADPAVPGAFPYIYCTAAGGDGSIWVAGEQCVVRFHASQPTRAFTEAPVRGEALRALCPDGESMWIGTYYSALLKADAAGVQVVAPRGTFPGGITSIVREAADTLWVSTSAGLHRWERGKVRSWTTSDGLLTANVRTIHRDDDGTLWLGTLGGGLARMKDGRFVHITTRHGLIDDVVSQIVPDDFGSLWLGTNRGLMRVERHELDAVADGTTTEVHPLIFARNEGMLNEQCSGGHSPTAHKTRHGRLLFPTAGGIAAIDPRAIANPSTFAPQPRIDEIRIDQQPQPLAAEVSIPAGRHRIELNYTAPSLRGGEWVRFRHRLEGFDRDWNTGARRQAVYDGLEPGRYVFRVAAFDGRGNWSEPGARVAFTVQPYLWQTLWFRNAAVLAVIGLTAGVAWWQVRRRHLRQLAEIERERRQQAELAHAGRVTLLGELSASLAHELKQPLAAILSNAQAALRFLHHEPAELAEVRDILKDIAAADRRASEIIERMRSLIRKGEAQMTRRDLNADIEQVLALLRSDLQSRHVTVSTQLAPELPAIRGDHIQLQQVLLNLIVNACDAMRDNGPDERLLVVETSHDGADAIRVSVLDRGPGIAPEVLPRLFEPFFTTKSHGLGMGLAICQAIVRVHGGQLSAENRVEGGAAFHFTLRRGEA